MPSITITIPPCTGCCDGCPPAGAPTHVSISVDYYITAHSCVGVPVPAEVHFVDIAGDLAPWSTTNPIGSPTEDICYARLASDDNVLTYNSSLCLPDCAGAPATLDIDAIWQVLLFFDGTDYWIYANIFTDGSFCGDLNEYGLPDTDSPFTNIGPSPIGSHTINYSSMTGPQSATFTIVIS